MSKKFNLFFVLLLSINITLLTGCNNLGDFNDSALDSTSEDEINELILSDYSLPDNFAMTIMLSDTSIFNKEDPAYYKTARIGNDWQIIEYDNSLADKTKQETHFFKYISSDNYTDYIYDYSKSDWNELESGSFFDMVKISFNNFKFIDTPPVGENMNIVETPTTYDTNPTSIVEDIDAIRYEYSCSLDYETIFDSNYPNLCLAECARNGSTICIEWRAYSYNTSITEWNNTYLINNNYKLIPAS